MDTLADSPIVSFAINAAQQLRAVAHELAQEPGIKTFCGSLAAELSNIHKGLGEQVGHTSQSLKVSDHRLSKVLENLERLCQGSVHRSLCPISSTGFDPRRYPTLSQLTTKKAIVKATIREFAQDRRGQKNRETLLKILSRALGKPRKAIGGPDLSEVSSVDNLNKRDDYQTLIQTLHRTLASHCICSSQDGSKPIIANLRLNSHFSTQETTEAVDFRIFFLDHPHHHGKHASCQWQDTKICVSRRKAVKMMTSCEAKLKDIQGKMISFETFCKTITRRERLQLKLMASESGLLLQEPCSLSEGYFLGLPSVSLAELLKAAKLSQKKKLMLSYFLAKAVWQFYDSPWMRQEWNKEIVHFMFARKSDVPKGICINEPFLSASFINEHTLSPDDNNFRSHLFPKILALGIMLLEVELGIWIEQKRKPDDLDPDGQPLITTDHIVAQRVFNETSWEDRDTFDSFKDVIQMCLVPEPFKEFYNNSNGLRDAIEERLVNPLQDIYKKAWRDDPEQSPVRAIDYDTQRISEAEENKKTIPLSPQSTPPPLFQTPVGISGFQALHQMHHHSHLLPTSNPMHTVSLHDPTHSLLSNQYINSNGTTMSTDHQTSSNDWFQQLNTLNSILRPKPNEKDTEYCPVRIAVLDTGVNESFAEQVEGYKDFVHNDDNNCQDKVGHGTNAFRLIKAVYNPAKLYVGRVFEYSEATNSTKTLMSDAIKYAQDIWEVEVIVIPSGFQSEHADLEAAIERAWSSHILVFAAASNYGNVRDVAFPGRLYRDFKLFCMFSTDAAVRAQSGFNPSGLADARYNFAIFGENVVLPGTDKPLSGTSYATMIGAALAARVLDFSRQKEICDKIQGIQKLSTVSGMSEVFANMARDGIDNGYHCITPWKIIPPEDERIEDSAKKRLHQRADICETISRALAGR